MNEIKEEHQHGDVLEHRDSHEAKMRVPETIRVDPDAYGILEQTRQRLIKNGRPGASFSDAIRELKKNE